MIVRGQDARHVTIQYHDEFYRTHDLFEKGSWLAEPEELILKYAKTLSEVQTPRVLDLGCGIGRNAIPVARLIEASGGCIDCIDFLPIAIQRLTAYGHEHGLNDLVVPHECDVECFPIPPERYDYVFSCSCIEHVPSFGCFVGLLERVREGTAQNGINCFLINSSVKETEVDSGKERPACIELNLETIELQELLRNIYKSWELLEMDCTPRHCVEKRIDTHVCFQRTCVMFVTRR